MDEQERREPTIVHGKLFKSKQKQMRGQGERGGERKLRRGSDRGRREKEVSGGEERG